ncbi:hypothetical protein T069G_08234 [Trichoderma breve]|uniref:Uncharacterized protein n=1 Tax=Trichoderma breve TaxID=2034170 RepID=A0A9W9B6B0_9HYPO|nr:hypothetical protein T069G_08234 [Trichoderma breve]KAJ4857337.1 hypothetical protein T069G_08234 [Trichoderma breve]
MEQKRELGAEKKAKELVTELFEKELAQWREQRDKASARNYLSRAEVDEQVHRLVEAVIQGVGMEKRRMEDGTEEPHEIWRSRMIALRKQITTVWNDNDRRILMGVPRRCEVDGDRCVVDCELIEEVEEEGEWREKVSHVWDWWDGAPEREEEMDSAEEAVEMWERRRRGARLEPVGGVMQWVEVRGFAPQGGDKSDSSDNGVESSTA